MAPVSESVAEERELARGIVRLKLHNAGVRKEVSVDPRGRFMEPGYTDSLCFLQGPLDSHLSPLHP